MNLPNEEGSVLVEGIQVVKQKKNLSYRFSRFISDGARLSFIVGGFFSFIFFLGIFLFKPDTQLAITLLLGLSAIGVILVCMEGLSKKNIWTNYTYYPNNQNPKVVRRVDAVSKFWNGFSNEFFQGEITKEKIEGTIANKIKWERVYDTGPCIRFYLEFWPYRNGDFFKDRLFLLSFEYDHRKDSPLYFYTQEGIPNLLVEYILNKFWKEIYSGFLHQTVKSGGEKGYESQALVFLNGLTE